MPTSWKGGVIALASGDNWEEGEGATAILTNSTFDTNCANAGNGGVASLGRYTTLFVAGDGNQFVGNTCDDEGGVFGGTTDTRIVIEGGVFSKNKADEVGGLAVFGSYNHFFGMRFATLQSVRQPHPPLYPILCEGAVFVRFSIRRVSLP